MKGHEDRCKNGVHGHRNGKRYPQFVHGEAVGGKCLHGIGHAHVLHEHGCALGEDDHGHVDAHAQETPHHHAWQHAEGGRNVLACGNAAAKHLAQGGKYAELEETHYHAMRGIERAVPFIQWCGKEEG